MKKLRALLTEDNLKSECPIDFTSIHGYNSFIQIDESMQFQTELYTPVLLALVFNKLDVARYMLEEL